MDRRSLALLLLCFANLALAADPSAPTPAEPPAGAEAAAKAAAEAEPATKVAAEAESAARAAAEADEDRVVCRTERSVGTRFEKKTCRKQSVWTQIEKRAEEDFGKVRNRPVTCPDCRD